MGRSRPTFPLPLPTRQSPKAADHPHSCVFKHLHTEDDANNNPSPNGKKEKMQCKSWKRDSQVVSKKCPVNEAVFNSSQDYATNSNVQANTSLRKESKKPTEDCIWQPRCVKQPETAKNEVWLLWIRYSSCRQNLFEYCHKLSSYMG